jgi:hypothetical protein
MAMPLLRFMGIYNLGQPVGFGEQSRNVATVRRHWTVPVRPPAGVVLICICPFWYCDSAAKNTAENGLS